MKPVSFLFQKSRPILHKIGMIFGLTLLIYQFVSSVIVLFQQKTIMVKPHYIFVALLFSLFVPLIMMINWKILLNGWKVKVGFREITEGFSLSFLPRYIPGTVWGYLSRNEWLYQEHQVDYKITNAANILEIIVSIISGFLLIGVYYGMNNPIRPTLIRYVELIFIVLLLLIITVGSTEKIRKHLPNSVSISLNVVRNWYLAVIFYMIQWIVVGIVFLLCVKSIVVIKSSPESVLPLLTIDYFLGWFVGFVIIFVPSGIGIREYIISNLLSSHFSIIPAEAYLVTIIMRCVLTLSELLWVMYGRFFVRLRS